MGINSDEDEIVNQTDINPASSPEPAAQATNSGASTTDSSSTENFDEAYGPNGPLPNELNHWNWAAFLGSWVWGLSQRVWVSLLIPPALYLSILIMGVTLDSDWLFDIFGYFPIIVVIVSALLLVAHIKLGFSGNAVAWRNKKYESIESFSQIQRRLVIPAILVAFLQLFVYASFVFVFLMLGGLR